MNVFINAKVNNKFDITKLVDKNLHTLGTVLVVYME